jgi:Ran GTPase-activating protein (RanGAP) involved in mRNA processing and transport
LLKTNQFLKRLKIGDNLITCVGAEYLAKGLSENTGLTQLHLGGNKIEVKGLQFIANALLKNTTLTSLGLRDNNVGASGMQALTELLLQPTCELSDIQLKGNFILPKGSYYLSQSIGLNKSLKVLELQSNSIGQSGVKVLCESLKDNKSIHALNFNDNELGDEGAEFIADLLKENTVITTLGLANNKIRKKGASKLAISLSNSMITGLDLGNNEIGNGGAVALAESLHNNTVLTSLDLRSCEIHLKGIIGLSQMVSVNTTLRHLDLGNNYCKNQGASEWAKVLAKNSTLTRLCLTDNQIYHDGGEALARALQTNFTLRNFSFGGQGSSANRIDSSVRRVIDSIVAENKKNWEISQSTDIPLKKIIESPSASPRESPRNSLRNLSTVVGKLKSSTVLSSSNPMYGLPTWFTMHEEVKEDKLLESRLNYIFTNNLLKAENPKFPGCYFIGNIYNTLRKVYPDTKVDEIQLVHFAYNHPRYYVHLSREMVKTQIKYSTEDSIQTSSSSPIPSITSPVSMISSSPIPPSTPTKILFNDQEEIPIELNFPPTRISPISLLKSSPREKILEEDLIDDSEWDNILLKTQFQPSKQKKNVFGVIGEPMKFSSQSFGFDLSDLEETISSFNFEDK